MTALLYAAAVHELGHVMTCYLLGGYPGWVLLQPKGGGECETAVRDPDSQTEPDAERNLLVGAITALAGLEAEWLILGVQPKEATAASDLAQFAADLGRLHTLKSPWRWASPQAAQRELARLIRQLLGPHQLTLTYLADRLMEERRWDGDRTRELLGLCRRTWHLVPVLSPGPAWAAQLGALLGQTSPRSTP